MNRNHIAEVREFNRFYTRIIGLLDKYLLHSDFTLPEVRVMYEIDHSGKITARQIIENMGIDKGYLSRILLKFDKKKIIQKVTSENDARVQLIQLTEKGQNEYNQLNNASHNQVAEILGKLSIEDQEALVNHFKQIQIILKNIK